MEIAKKAKATEFDVKKRRLPSLISQGKKAGEGVKEADVKTDKEEEKDGEEPPIIKRLKVSEEVE